MVVDDDAVLAEAERLADRLADGPTVAFGRIKALLAASLDCTLSEQLVAEERAIAASAAGPRGRGRTGGVRGEAAAEVPVWLARISRGRAAGDEPAGAATAAGAAHARQLHRRARHGAAGAQHGPRGDGGQQAVQSGARRSADAGAQQLLVLVVLGDRGGDIALRRAGLDERAAGALAARRGAHGDAGDLDGVDGATLGRQPQAALLERVQAQLAEPLPLHDDPGRGPAGQDVGGEQRDVGLVGRRDRRAAPGSGHRVDQVDLDVGEPSGSSTGSVNHVVGEQPGYVDGRDGLVEQRAAAAATPGQRSAASAARGCGPRVHREIGDQPAGLHPQRHARAVDGEGEGTEHRDALRERRPSEIVADRQTWLSRVRSVLIVC